MMGFGPKLRQFSQLEDPQSTKYLNDEEPATHKGHTKLQVEAVSYAEQVIKLMDSVLMERKATVEINKEHPCARCTELLF